MANGQWPMANGDHIIHLTRAVASKASRGGLGLRRTSPRGYHERDPSATAASGGATMMSHPSARYDADGPPHWEAASASYLFLLCALGALFLLGLLTHPPVEGTAWQASSVSTHRASKKGASAFGRPSSTPSRPVRDCGTAPTSSPLQTTKTSGEECRISDEDSGTSRRSRALSSKLPEDSSLPPSSGGESFLRSSAFPDSTPAERLRFLNARDGDVEAAAEMLQKYLDWRKEHAGGLTGKGDAGRGTKTGQTDGERHWARSCEAASEALGEDPASPPPPVLYWAVDDRGRPKRSKDGRRILQHLPARIDTSLASGHFYALALAIFIDRTLDRTSDEKFCVVIDARPGTGWGNVPAPKLVSFIKHAAALLNSLHPERLAQCVLFPVPFWAKGLWNMIRPFLDPDTVEKICLVSGPDKVDSEPPAKLTNHFDKNVVDLMERKRISCFEEEA